ncbi:MAG: hypothetical protein PUE61_10520 [Clostridiales bacterium]|nr:hypothetical protein [Clostridiales bacterium]
MKHIFLAMQDPHHRRRRQPGGPGHSPCHVDSAEALKPGGAGVIHPQGIFSLGIFCASFQ